MARGDAAGVPFTEPIREIRDIAFQIRVRSCRSRAVPAWEAHAVRELAGLTSCDIRRGFPEPMTLSVVAGLWSTDFASDGPAFPRSPDLPDPVPTRRSREASSLA